MKTNRTNKTRKVIAGALAAVMMTTSAANIGASAFFNPFDQNGLLDIRAFSIQMPDKKTNDNADKKATVVDHYNGHDVIESTYKCGVTDYKFLYSDGIFEDDFVQYSDHMATLACSMGHASCTHVEKGSYENGAQNIRALLENAGFTDIYVSESYTKKPTEDSIACVIASKMVHTKDGDKKVIAIAVRSGGYEKEWASNVKLGKSGEAEGFSSAADQIVGKKGTVLDFDSSKNNSYLNDYFRIYGTEDLDEGNVIFWLNGFSRGGATANLSAKRLVDATSGSTNSVIAYCIEAPQGGVASEEKSGSDYRTIHNVINEDDFVPYVAPSSMGFKRYGVDHYVQRGEAHSDRIIAPGEMYYSNFPNNASDNFDSTIDLNMQTKRMKQQLLEMVGNDKEKAAALAPYKITHYKYSIYDPYNYSEDKNNHTSTANFIRDFMNEITVSNKYSYAGMSRDRYSEIQYEIAEFMSYYYGSGDLSALTDMNIFNYPDMIVRAYVSMFKNPIDLYYSLECVGDKVYVDMQKYLRQDLVKHLGEVLLTDGSFVRRMRNYPGGSGNAVETIKELVDNLLVGKKDVNHILTFAKNIDGIFGNHEFVTTAAWLRSFDDWYDCYYSEEFVQKSVDKLPKDIPVSIALGQVVNKNIKSATVKIYGKTVSGINRHGEYDVSEEKLLKEVTLTKNGTANAKIPSGILPESIRIVLSFEDGDSRPLSNGGELTGEYLIKLARVTAPDVSYANISDIEIGFGYHARKDANYGMISMGFKNTSAGSFGTYQLLQKC